MDGFLSDIDDGVFEGTMLEEQDIRKHIQDWIQELRETELERKPVDDLYAMLQDNASDINKNFHKTAIMGDKKAIIRYILSQQDTIGNQEMELKQLQNNRGKTK